MFIESATTERYYICMAEVIIAQLESLLRFASRVADTLESPGDAMLPLVATHPSLPSFSPLLSPRASPALYLIRFVIRRVRRCAVHKSIISRTIRDWFDLQPNAKMNECRDIGYKMFPSHVRFSNIKKNILSFEKLYIYIRTWYAIHFSAEKCITCQALIYINNKIF